MCPHVCLTLCVHIGCWAAILFGIVLTGLPCVQAMEQILTVVTAMQSISPTVIRELTTPPNTLDEVAETVGVDAMSCDLSQCFNVIVYPNPEVVHALLIFG